jgi:hypothetical protein
MRRKKKMNMTKSTSEGGKNERMVMMQKKNK